MTKVTAQMSVSLDGYYAGPRSTADPHDMAAWMEGLEAPGFFRVTRWVIDAMAWRERLGFAGGEQSVNSRIVEETFAAAGAYVMGRRMFEGGEIPWGDEPPFRAPVFVVTHRDREVLERQGGTSFTFVTDGIARAIEMAREAAGGKNVAVAGGGTLVRQILAAVGRGVGAGPARGHRAHPGPRGRDARGDAHPLRGRRPGQAGARRPRLRRGLNLGRPATLGQSGKELSEGDRHHRPGRRALLSAGPARLPGCIPAGEDGAARRPRADSARRCGRGEPSP
jgi:dihydrofolate reductase